MGAIAAQNNLFFCQLREFAVGGHVKAVAANLKGSDEYATNGDSLNVGTIGAGQKAKIIAVVPTLTDSGDYYIVGRRVSLYDFKLVFYEAGVMAEVTAATDLSAETFTLLVYYQP